MKTIEDFDRAIDKLDELILEGFSLLLLAENDFRKQITQSTAQDERDKSLEKHRLKHNEWHDKHIA